MEKCIHCMPPDFLLLKQLGAAAASSRPRQKRRNVGYRELAEKAHGHGNSRDRTEHCEQDQPGWIYSGVLPAMSLSDWMYRAVAGGFLAALLCCGLSANALAQGEGNNPGRQERPADQERKPETENKPVTLGTVQDAIKRIAGAIEAQKDEADAKRKDQREESDLQAQWQMARWAEYVFYAALGSLGVTGLGVFLVWRTLRHTRDAAVAAKDMVAEAKAATKAAQETVEEARKATKFAQVTADAAKEALAITDRAWIKIEVKLTDPLVFGAETITTSAEFTFRNVGKAPATNVSTMMKLYTDELTAGNAARDFAKVGPLYAELHFGVGAAIFPGETHTVERAFEVSIADFRAQITKHNQWGAEADTPYTVTVEQPCFLVGVSYVLPGDRGHRFTYAPFVIKSVDPRHGGWNGDECTVSQNVLVLKPGFMGGLVK